MNVDGLPDSVVIFVRKSNALLEIAKVALSYKRQTDR